MFAVYFYDDAVMDDVVVFTGTLADCQAYVADDDDDDLYIVAPDGFTVVD